MGGIDEKIFWAVNKWPDSLEPLFVTLSEGNKWLPVKILLGAFLIYCLWRRDTRPAAIVAMVAWPVANEICDILKAWIPTTRPSVDLWEAAIRTPKLTSSGTASAHSANMMAVAIAFLIYWRPVGYIWLVVAVLTGISRIYVGAHYPYQVLFGWLVGGVVATAVSLFWEGWKAWRQPVGTEKSEMGPANPEPELGID